MQAHGRNGLLKWIGVRSPDHTRVPFTLPCSDPSSRLHAKLQRLSKPSHPRLHASAQGTAQSHGARTMRAYRTCQYQNTLYLQDQHMQHLAAKGGQQPELERNPAAPTSNVEATPTSIIFMDAVRCPNKQRAAPTHAIQSHSSCCFVRLLARCWCVCMLACRMLCLPITHACMQTSCTNMQPLLVQMALPLWHKPCQPSAKPPHNGCPHKHQPGGLQWLQCEVARPTSAWDQGHHTAVASPAQTQTSSNLTATLTRQPPLPALITHYRAQRPYCGVTR